MAQAFSDATWIEAMKHQGMVHTIARRYRGCGLDLEDLKQEGLIGACKAVERFDAGLGELSSHLWRGIREAIEAAVARGGRTVRVPRATARLCRSVDAGRTRLEDLPRARRAGVLAARAALAAPGDLGVALRVMGDCGPEDGDDERELAEKAVGALDAIPARERDVLVGRFGLSGSSARTLRTLGPDLGVTHESVRQIEKRAINRLWRVMHEKPPTARTA